MIIKELEGEKREFEVKGMIFIQIGNEPGWIVTESTISEALEELHKDSPRWLIALERLAQGEI
ncbi:MAG: hypothetical protein JSU01_06335 [Bacteroidetes bacterium]|nr:hypothetical protein [Bacteroidota bacterium]